MANTQNISVSQVPLPQKRGLDVDTRRRIENTSIKSFGDIEIGRDIYETTIGIKPPDEMLTKKGFPVLLFLVMIVFDILDIIVGFFDVSGITWVIRIILLNLLPIVIILFWTKKTAKSYEKELTSKLESMFRQAQRTAGTDMKKLSGGKRMKRLILKLLNKVLRRAVFKKILKYFIAALIPIIAFFSLWSVFVYFFHKDRNKLAKKINSGFKDMYRLQNQQDQL